jgi:hypothetical protein
MVIKSAGVYDGEDSFVKEVDIEEKEAEKEEEEKANKKTEKFDSEKWLPIAIGIIFGLLACILISLAIYHFWKKRSLK